MKRQMRLSCARRRAVESWRAREWKSGRVASGVESWRARAQPFTLMCAFVCVCQRQCPTTTPDSDRVCTRPLLPFFFLCCYLFFGFCFLNKFLFEFMHMCVAHVGLCASVCVCAGVRNALRKILWSLPT